MKITNRFKTLAFDRFPNKVKCTFRKEGLSLSDFTLSASKDYTYYETITQDGCTITFSIRTNGQFPKRMFKIKFPPEISINGNEELMNIRLATSVPIKKLNSSVVDGIRTQELNYSDKDVTIYAKFELANEELIKVVLVYKYGHEKLNNL